MMKKFKLLAFSLAMIAAAGFISCASDDESSGSSDGSGSSTYTTDDLIGKWTSNDPDEGFSENVFTFLNATQVTVYDGSTTETMNYTLSGSSITIEGQPDYVKSMTLISKTQFTMKVYMYDIWWTGTYTKQGSSSSDTPTASTTGTAFDYVTTDTSNPLGAALAKLSAGESLADGTYGEVKIGQAKFAYVKRGRANASSRASDGQYLTLATPSGTDEYNEDGGTVTINVKKGAKVSITAKFDEYCSISSAFVSGDYSTLYDFEFRPKDGGGFCTATATVERDGNLCFCNTEKFDIEISEIKVEY